MGRSSPHQQDHSNSVITRQADTQGPLLSFVSWVDGSWVEGEAGVGREPDHQVLVLADPLDALGGGIGHVGQGGTREVGQLEVLEKVPDRSSRVTSASAAKCRTVVLEPGAISRVA